MLQPRLSPRPSPMGAGSLRVGLVSSYPPSRCGVGKFAESMVNSLAEVAPDLELDVVRLIDGRAGPSALDRVAMEVDPDSPVGLRMAARHLNRCDAIVLQHEYGIYGAHDGEAVVELLGLLERPTLAVLHTVPARPSERQRRILEELHSRCRLVAPSESARSALAQTFGFLPAQVTVIPHGAHWHPQPVRTGPYRRLISWGLIGPGKGLERSIRAVARLRDIAPDPTYRIVGMTHPTVARAEGLTYRRFLQSLVGRLDLGDMVEFVDRFVDDQELCSLVADADIVVVPYDNDEQTSSGVITEAVAMGRPVVATRFPHASELLGPGPGLTVDHDDGASLAQAIRVLMEQPEKYQRAAAAARRRSEELSWTSAARRYADLIGSVANRLATA